MHLVERSKANRNVAGGDKHMRQKHMLLCGSTSVIFRLLIADCKLQSTGSCLWKYFQGNLHLYLRFVFISCKLSSNIYGTGSECVCLESLETTECHDLTLKSLSCSVSECLLLYINQENKCFDTVNEANKSSIRIIETD